MKVTYRQIRKALASAAFQPKKPGRMAPILDKATHEYLLMRSRELLAEALDNSLLIAKNITLVMSLLAVVKADYEQTIAKVRESGGKDSSSDSGLSETP